MAYYYGTKSALDWVLGHYFFRQIHYTWLADCFYPYKQPNPKSSNPFEIYKDLYAPWKDEDGYDTYIRTRRIDLVKAILAKEKEGVVEAALGMDLRDMCNNVNIVFFYPVVYRVDISKIAPGRRQVANSGLRGSCECLVADLAENEFEVLFLDFEKDADFKNIVKSSVLGHTYLDSYEVMDILKRRS